MIETRNLIAKIATNNDEIEACKRLRHRIFLRGLNEGIGDSEQGVKLDEDIYDSLAEHIILIDRKRLCKGLNNYAVGTCRLIVGSASDGPNHFYSNSEFVIDSLVKSRNLFLEVGRSCVDHEYRDGLALYLLWLALVKYLENKEVEIIFGVASFKGNSPHEFNHALSFLHYNHLSKKITVPARPEGFLKLNQMAEEHINVQQAKKQLPSLLKTYLSFGGQIGEGAFIDRQLKTIDIFVFAEKSNIINKYKIS